ncbi:Cysteine protease atg4b [Linnemannia schmuckeri]|uniref:Autophagy-related protein 4 n=1 Tax=Linnemannia schmuckeri TaxID=64567 RepID=A0A9P5RN97_9FUNG|nr:Cysteine protease atg4b [Linnemannia schmuckeri]
MDCTTTTSSSTTTTATKTTKTAVKGPPASLPAVALPLLPLEVRPSFTRSRSQQNLTSPTRLYNTVSSALGRSRVDLLSSPSSEQPPAVPPIPSSYAAQSPSAFASMQKVYHSYEDISFWSTLYAQHHVHTRQENQGGEQQQGSPEATSTAASFYLAAEQQQQRRRQQQQQQHCGEATGSIKVWQVLTKTVLDDPATKPIQEQLQKQQQQQQQPLSRPSVHFERLPIKVQTSASALSPDGHPFSIVFFFTVESAPVTLWYLESAFTQSSTVHEHMELMGTFQPNDTRDPTSFYIYETHAFNIVQPLQEDTMLDIHVQNPAGTIYAEFSYTFIKEPKVGTSTSSLSSSTLSLPNSPRTVARQEKNSCSSTDDINGITPATTTTAASLLAAATITVQTTIAAKKGVERPLSPALSPLDGYDLVERESPSSPGYFPVFKDEQSSAFSSSPSLSSSTKKTESSVPSIPSNSVMSESSTQASLHNSVAVAGFEQDEIEQEDDEHDESEAVFVESLSEEPDAGEHFMQATSEFFSKMGYWLYNSKVVQYIARDDRSRIKTLFQTDDIWILGVIYTFDQSELPLSLHETPRSRKSSTLQAHAITASRSGGNGGGGGGGGGVAIGDSKGSSASNTSPVSDHGGPDLLQPKLLMDRPRSHTISSPRARADSDAHSRISTFSRRQDSYVDIPRSRSKERKLEKQREKELAREDAKAKKLARAKERELEKEQQRQLEREKAKEKARLKEQEKIQKFKAKISHPHFDRNSALDGSSHLSAILALDSKEHGYLNVQREPERKSQSIHGYQHEDRPNVGLGLSTDAAEPKQQEEYTIKEYPQEPAPTEPSPEHSPPPPSERPRSTKQRLLNLPSALLTNLPRQRSPSSSSMALNKSWKAISPRSPTSRSTLPLVAAISSPSMPSLPHFPSNPSSPQSPELEYPAGILDPDETSETRPDTNGISRRDLSSSSRFSTVSHLSAEKPASVPVPSPNRVTLTRFMTDFQSRIWFTYRKEISRIEPSFYTSDAGWGCMMRTGQSLLAQAFVQVMLGRDWRVGPSASEESCKKYSTLLSWFADEPDRYYSIHSIAKMGVALDKRVGEWFNPSTVAHALRHPDCPVAIMVSMDGTIRITDLVNTATGKEIRSAQSYVHGMTSSGSPDPQRQPHQPSGQWKPVVVMMPARYGLEKLKEGYVANLKQLFKLPQFLGIAGGRPGRSLYFVAYQGNELFYFDPHTVKARATHEEMSQCPSPSYHCNVVRTMDIMELDPSMMLGFLIRSMQDLAELMAEMKHSMDQRYSLFTIIGNPPLTTAPKSAPAPIPAPIHAPVPTSAPAPFSAPTQTFARALTPAPTPTFARALTPAPAPTLAPSLIPASAPVPIPAPILAPVQTSAPAPIFVRAHTPTPAPILAPSPIAEPPLISAQSPVPSPSPAPVLTPAPPVAAVALNKELAVVNVFVHRTSTDMPAPDQEVLELEEMAVEAEDEDEEEGEVVVVKEEAVVEMEEEEVVEEEIVESIVMDFTFEVLEQVALELAKSQTGETPAAAECKVEEKAEEEKLVVVEEDVLISPQEDANSTTTFTPTPTSPVTSPMTSPVRSPTTCLMTGVNLDAPLPPLPQFEPLVPVPVLRPISTSPVESRPKKEMKRITRAFQKEKWMIKPRSSKSKKVNSSLPIEEVTTTAMADQIVYKYATTLGEEDAIYLHDQDTLSVKSFDSDLSL